MKTWIEKAAAADIDEMGRLYDSLNDYLEQHVNYPGWRKGIYPAREDAEKGIVFMKESKEDKIKGVLVMD